jgi:hypothetical protein
MYVARLGPIGYCKVYQNRIIIHRLCLSLKPNQAYSDSQSHDNAT